MSAWEVLTKEVGLGFYSPYARVVRYVLHTPITNLVGESAMAHVSVRLKLVEWFLYEYFSKI